MLKETRTLHRNNGVYVYISLLCDNKFCYRLFFHSSSLPALFYPLFASLTLFHFIISSLFLYIIGIIIIFHVSLIVFELIDILFTYFFEVYVTHIVIWDICMQ